MFPFSKELRRVKRNQENVTSTPINFNLLLPLNFFFIPLSPCFCGQNIREKIICNIDSIDERCLMTHAFYFFGNLRMNLVWMNESCKLLGEAHALRWRYLSKLTVRFRQDVRHSPVRYNRAKRWNNTKVGVKV